jgi:3-hydroxybutyryl-CoA dehydrogenase
MGSGIACRSALAQNKTVLVDLDAEGAQRGLEQAKKHLEELRDNDLASPGRVQKAETLLSVSTSLEDTLQSTRLVIEAIVENLPVKQDLFAKLDALLPRDIPIVSNTSGLRISDIAAKMVNPQRAVTGHFWFPAHLVPLVEVVVGDKGDIEIAKKVYEEFKRWDKEPVLVKKDLPGQLANRILQAIIREAANIVEIGLASPEDVDRAVKMGMGIRFPAWGPLEHVDGVGLDLCISVQDTVLPGLSTAIKANDYMRALTAKGQLGHKTGKGIYDWSVKDMDALQRQRNEFIIYALKKLKPKTGTENR